VADNVRMVAQGTAFEDLDTASNTIQTITLANATGGTFTLTLSGNTTSAIAFNAAASAVQTALEGLTGVGAGNVLVTGSAGGPYTVEFTGTLARKAVAALTANGASLTGSSPTVTPVRTVVGFAGVDIAWGLGASAQHEIGYAPPSARSRRLLAAITAGLVEETATAVTTKPTYFGFRRVKLSRVLARAPQNGDILTFDGTTHLWVPEVGK
jgi:hypothetical protein